jgi:carbon monoxide dehydrogenase subunit G
VSGSPYVIAYRGQFDLDDPPDAVWGSIERCERFETWWAWLREFRLEGDGLERGAVLHGVVVPPVPYAMRIRVEIDAVSPHESVEATVHGDLEGTARLELASSGPGTVAEVSWTIEMMQRPMRLAARLGGPVLRWGHDRVVDATVAGYRRNVERERRAGE